MFLKNTLVFRFVHFIRTLSHPEFEEMEDIRDHRLRLRSSICLKRLDIFYKIFSSVLVATERQNQNFILTNGSMCLNKTWPWSHHCDNIQKLIKKKPQEMWCCSSSVVCRNLQWWHLFMWLGRSSNRWETHRNQDVGWLYVRAPH